MINDYSLSKVFYEDLYKAFIFYVEHPRKVYKLFMRNIGIPEKWDPGP